MNACTYLTVWKFTLVCKLIKESKPNATLKNKTMKNKGVLS